MNTDKNGNVKSVAINKIKSSDARETNEEYDYIPYILIVNEVIDRHDEDDEENLRSPFGKRFKRLRPKFWRPKRKWGWRIHG